MELEFGNDFPNKYSHVVECCDYFAWLFGQDCGKKKCKYRFVGDKRRLLDREWRDMHVNV